MKIDRPFSCSYAIFRNSFERRVSRSYSFNTSYHDTNANIGRYFRSKANVLLNILPGSFVSNSSTHNYVFRCAVVFFANPGRFRFFLLPSLVVEPWLVKLRANQLCIGIGKYLDSIRKSTHGRIKSDYSVDARLDPRDFCVR